MQLDSDIGYIGEYYGSYNYDACYLQFGGDLGMLEILTTKNCKWRAIPAPSIYKSRVTPAPSIDKSKATPAPSIKASIAEALHEAMRYKPTTTSNKYAALAPLECEELRDVF